MKLNGREVEVLDHLAVWRGRPTEIASALGIALPNLVNYLKKLERYKLIAYQEDGAVELDRAVWFSFIDARSSFTSLKLSDVLTSKAPFLLSFILSKRRFKLSDLDLPPASAKRLLAKLRSLGLIFMPAKGVYLLRNEAHGVARFCRQMLVKIYADDASHELGGIQQMEYSFNSAQELECIFVTSQESYSKLFWPTAYSVFHKYGIKLILAGKYYYSNVKPKLQDVVIHSLAVNRDERSIAYVCTLMEKNHFNPEKLLKVKQRFGLSEEFLQDLVKFIHYRGAGKIPQGFPYWGEVEEIVNG